MGINMNMKIDTTLYLNTYKVKAGLKRLSTASTVVSWKNRFMVKTNDIETQWEGAVIEMNIEQSVVDIKRLNQGN